MRTCHRSGSRGRFRTRPQAREARRCRKVSPRAPPALRPPISLCLRLRTPNFSTKSCIKYHGFYEALHEEAAGCCALNGRTSPGPRKQFCCLPRCLLPGAAPRPTASSLTHLHPRPTSTPAPASPSSSETPPSPPGGRATVHRHVPSVGAWVWV